ncbi:hypothetical protein IU449_03810 [Nocardia higoensis]|uniref:Beta-ketoacyl-[acyl-carrier-protein] synthase III N-terminal domain-containing protein n=1 Tax=Nocardia higoensis TaxID=228599 RepID=A0ABS0D5S5_9NOCA|nr:hypothetical protein [Nocardia higoensis]MBF6353681.1 hypothetical protein [Nocardia higoensis]
MSVRITSTAISRGGDTASIVAHSGRAARLCLERAGVRPDQVGVLINTGVFRDSNTVEPAVAALIQKEAGIGLEYATHDPRTFAFDLMNGATGVLEAVRVATSILETGSAEYVLIVSGDTHPSLSRHASTDDFPYATCGAAMLLGRTDEPAGFGTVRSVAGAGTPAVEGYVDTAAMGTTGRGAMTVVREDAFEERLLAAAVEAAASVLAESGVGEPGELALVTSTPTPDFGGRVADALGIDRTHVRVPDLTDGDPHTASLTAAFDRAVVEDTLTGYRRVLFVAAGAGPSAAAVLYRLPVPAGVRA